MPSTDPPLRRHGFDTSPELMVAPYLELIRRVFPIDRALARLVRDTVEMSTPGLPFEAVKAMADSSLPEERRKAAARIIVLYDQDPAYFMNVAHSLLEDETHIAFQAGDALLFMANMGVLPIDDFLTLQKSHPNVEWLDSPEFD